MAANHQALDLAIILLIYGSRLLSAVRLRGLELPVESGSDVLVTCEGSSTDVEYLSSISIYGKLPDQAEKPLINVVGTLIGVRKDWSTDVEASFRERASYTASMTRERAFIGLIIRNLSCSDSGMMFRCKLVGVGVSATSVATPLRVQARFTRLYIDGGGVGCDSVTSQSPHMRIGCNGCDRAAIRGKVTSFSCWGDVDANLRDNFSISWYRTAWDNSSQQWTNAPLEGVRSDLVTNDTMLVPGQNDSDCQFNTLKSTLEYRLQLDEQDMEITCEISGPAEQGLKIYANRTIKTCGVDPEDVPMTVGVTPQSIIADIGNSTVFLCTTRGDPPITYEWFKMIDSSKVAISGRNSNTGFLQIDSVREETTGTYICLAKDLYRSKEVGVQLRYPEQPEMILPEEVVVIPGVPIDLVCDVRASGRVDRLTWPVKIADAEVSRGVTTLSTAQEVRLRGPNATAILRIGMEGIDFRASGNYSCQTTVHGVTFSKSTYIRVEGRVSIEHYTPRSTIRMLLGSTPYLTCSQKGNPEPVITWLFKNRPVTSGANAVITTVNRTRGIVDSTLKLVNFTRAMIGNYTCQAENRHSVASVDFTVLRKGPPAAPILSVRRNQDGQFHLNVKANPDDGGDPVSSYTVTYQLFPQGRTHRLTFSAEVDIPTTTVSVTPEGSLRLEGGTHINNGRVAIYHNGVWGTICDDGFDEQDAKVVCRQLGWHTTNVKFVSGVYGTGSGPIHLESLGCRGTEAKLTDCPSDGWGRHDCTHGEDVGVKCEQPTTTVSVTLEGRLRLEGGTHINNGRVVIYHNGVWGTICDDGFDEQDAKVACRQLGWHTTNVKFGSGIYETGSGPIHLESLGCRGTESKLTDCPSDGWGRHDCTHSEDVGVKCEQHHSQVNPEKVARDVITLDKIADGHAHYVAVRGTNAHGTGEPAELLLDI